MGGRKVMKKIISMLCGLMAIVITACSNEEIPAPESQTPATPGEKVSVKAYAPGDGQDASRVSLTESGGTISLAWETNESFSVIRGSENQTFSKTTAGNTFTGVLPTDGSGDYYAFYPAATSADMAIDLSTQTGALDKNLTYMYATSTDGKAFTFSHCTALLNVSFDGLAEGATIKQIKVNVDGAKVNGNFNPLQPAGDWGGSSKTITIKYTEPASLGDALYLYLPPMTGATKKLTFEVTTGDNAVWSGNISRESSKDLEAGKLYTASVSLSNVPTPYVTFTALGEQKLRMSKTVNNLQYSVDGGANWSDLGDSEVSFDSGKNLLLRGKSSYGTNDANIVFTNDVKVACTGDIRTLVDWETYTTVDTKNAKFVTLFDGCTQLTSAPALPATTLAEYCYYAMFDGCTSLESAPELPATTLAKNCYEYMFEGCTSLETAPALPATTLAECCYDSMFQYCSSLTSAPELKATVLAEYCYSDMFYDCTSLETAPALPATTLQPYCYHYMFHGCTSLTSAPELKATFLAQGCYSGMFSECISLEDAPELPATTLDKQCYAEMFFKCTSLKTAPALPATTLQPYCYDSMFQYCSSLTSAPELKAEILTECCYRTMFSHCTSLAAVTMLATNISAYYCLNNWLNDVASSGGVITRNPATELPDGSSGKPSGWKYADE